MTNEEAEWVRKEIDREMQVQKYFAATIFLLIAIALLSLLSELIDLKKEIKELKDRGPVATTSTKDR